MTREDAILCLKGIYNYGRDTFTEQSDWQESLDMAIKALEQEPFINKPCISSGVCEHDKQKALDKVYAEIEELQRDMLYASKVEFDDIYKIIDKYKAKSEK